MGITASPNWEWYLVAYFFFGGIAAGAFFIAGLIELVGDEHDQLMARGAYYLALPLVLLCTVFLVIDLGRPERFWHMMIQSNTFRPMFKYWSPMSYGSWILGIFGGLAAIAFVDALAEDNRVGSGLANVAGRLRRGPIGKIFGVLAMLAGFGLASYTGSLLGATNVPIWSNTTVLGGLFMASAASTGIAALVLLQRRRAAHQSIERLESADTFAMGLELVMIVVFIASLGGLAGTFLSNKYGLLVIIGTGIVGLLIPLAMRIRPQLLGRNGGVVSAVLVLIGGLILRYGILFAGQSLTFHVG